MKRKGKHLHPRCLPSERSESPILPNDGDEIYPNGIFFFHISAMNSWLNENPQPIIDMPLHIWESDLDQNDCYIESADITRPILIAEIAPDYKDFVPNIPEKQWLTRGYVCIDGHHRIEKAKRLGMKTLPAVILRMEQHIPFLYAGYKAYAEYWNNKLKERSSAQKI